MYSELKQLSCDNILSLALILPNQNSLRVMSLPNVLKLMLIMFGRCILVSIIKLSEFVSLKSMLPARSLIETSLRLIGVVAARTSLRLGNYGKPLRSS